MIRSYPVSSRVGHPNATEYELKIDLVVAIAEVDRPKQTPQHLLRIPVGSVPFRRVNIGGLRSQLTVDTDQIWKDRWPRLSGAFADNGSLFYCYSDEDNTLRCWDLTKSEVTKPMAEAMIMDVPVLGKSSRPIWSTGETLRVVAKEGIYDLDMTTLETKDYRGFGVPVGANSEVTVSRSGSHLLIVGTDRARILSLDSLRVVVDALTDTELSANLSLGSAKRMRLHQSGVPVVDWSYTQFDAAGDASWFAIRLADTTTIQLPTNESATVPRKRLLLLEASSSSPAVERVVHWKPESNVKLDRMSVSNDGRWCALYNDRYLVILDLWNREGIKQVFADSIREGVITSVAIASNKNSTRAAVCTSEGLLVMGLPSGRLIEKLSVAGATNAQFTAEASGIMLGFANGTLQNILLESNQVTKEIKAMNRGTPQFVFDQTQENLVTAGEQGVLRRWNYGDSEPIDNNDVDSPVAGMDLYEDQGLLVARLVNNSIVTWQWPSLKLHQKIPPENRQIFAVCPTLHGKRLFVARWDALVLMDSISGVEIMTATSFAIPAIDARLTQNGRQLVTLHQDGTLSQFDLFQRVSNR